MARNDPSVLPIKREQGKVLFEMLGVHEKKCQDIRETTTSVLGIKADL